MALCVHCKAKETELYDNGSPICLKCAELRSFNRADHQGVQVALVQALAEATLLAESACTEFAALSGDIPSAIPHPDGVQRIHNASRRLSAARDKMMRAHTRLNDFIEHGIVPDDLKPSG